MSDRREPRLRIVSLLPSATEIVACLGETDSLVGRSHECDHPAQVQQLPVCTQPKLDPKGSSAQIHAQVEQLLQSALSVYQVDVELLKQLQPTHIITQSQCDACAVSLADVEAAVGEFTGHQPQIVSLEPHTLADVWQDIKRVAAALQVPQAAEEAIASLQSRVDACKDATEDLPTEERPRVACIEWTEPLMAAGNWVPELVRLAGGRPVLMEETGKHSPWVQMEQLQATDPDAIVFMPCGFGLERTREAALPLLDRPEWKQLSALQQGQVYFVDGNAYFNRPGPGLVESIEILAEILHPQIFQFGYQNQAWEAASLVAV
ncbi:cobalamin-binding protein [Geitlerinema sp. PCC 9228]|jgi:iron complex transport system substrate-binding protein|uniref:cobalamin-binding protein n=1 Tax=Geitlerinema sp. PCC 9228 TaxID=111611 RepID=UPI0008F99A4F|nr:cobalamin-binding protein [Geitlerinema sp. PCC 9228]